MIVFEKCSVEYKKKIFLFVGQTARKYLRFFFVCFDLLYVHVG